MIFWRGEGQLPENIASSYLASLVVRGKFRGCIIRLFKHKKLFLERVGEGSDLLLGQMNAWQFDQLTVGFNLHFHTHNEFAEHFSV